MAEQHDDNDCRVGPAGAATPRDAGAGTPLTRRGLLRRITGGALALGLGGSASTLLTGCSSGGTFPLPQATPLPGSRLLVSTFLQGTVEAFDSATGAAVGTFAPSRGQQFTTAGIIPGPGDDLFVFSPGGNAVFRYDKNTGQAEGTLAEPAKGLTTPHSGVIGPDGLLYVVNAPSLDGNVGRGTDGIEQYNPATGAYLGRFADISSPFGITFGPDGDLYVSSTLAYSPVTPNSDYISRFDGNSGTFLGVAVRDIKVPFTMAWHPSGDLLVVQHFDGRVDRYDVNSRTLVGTFLQVPFPVGIAYGPDGDLYVAQFTTPDRFQALMNNDVIGALGGGKVLQYDGTSGALKRTLIDNLPFAGYLAFV